jgi:hypothetical protein
MYIKMSFYVLYEVQRVRCIQGHVASHFFSKKVLLRAKNAAHTVVFYFSMQIQIRASQDISVIRKLPTACLTLTLQWIIHFVIIQKYNVSLFLLFKGTVPLQMCAS